MSVVARAPSATSRVVRRTCTGGEFSPGARTVTVAVALAVPPRPSEIPYPKASVPVDVDGSVSCSCWPSSMMSTRQSTPSGTVTSSMTRTSPFTS